MQLGDLMRNPSIRANVAFVGGDRDAGPIERLTIIERLGDLEQAPSDTLCLCTAGASAEADTYRLDVAIRSASGRGVRGILLKREDTRLGPSAIILAERAGIGLLTVPPTTDLGDLVLDVTSMIGQGVEQLVRNAAALVRQVDDPEQQTLPDFEDWADMASTLLGRPVSVNGDPAAVGSDQLSAHAIVGSDPAVTFSASSAAPVPDAITELALRSLALCATERLAHGSDQLVGERTLASTLAEVVLSEQAPEELLARAEQLGVRMDDTHMVARFHVSGETQIRPSELAAFDDRSRRVVRRVFETVGFEAWRPIAVAETITYSWNGQEQDVPVPNELRRLAAAVMSALQQEMAASAACGIGGAHRGVPGLRASAAEARAALSQARQTGSTDPMLYDAMGLRRMLLDWTTAEAPRRAFDRLLRPLMELSPKRREKLLATVVTLFEHEGSATAAARVLDVHRNTIDQRVAEIYDRVDLDPAEADHRLMLYLAARSWAD